MKIPSGFIGSFQPPSVAELRRAREPQAREAGTGDAAGERISADGAVAARGELLRQRADAFESGRVRRIDGLDTYSGPGRSAVAAYLSVARSPVEAAVGAELVGIDVVV
jgi:hypothetical protein